MLFSHKKGRNPIPPFMITCMDFEGIMLNEISQIGRDTSQWNLIKKKNPPSLMIQRTNWCLPEAGSGKIE